MNHNLLSLSQDKIFSHITSKTHLSFVKKVIERMTKDEVYGDGLIELLNKGVLETRSAVSWLAKKIQPSTYLEVGTRRGWSLAMVAENCPSCKLYSFDEWHANYGGSPNPGPEFVKNELRQLGCDNEIEFISGDSHVTLREFFSKRPDLTIDLALVDGDHSVQGAAQDLEDVIPHISKGGAIVFDDIVDCQRLDEVWYGMKDKFKDFTYFSYITHSPGVGFAIRHL